MVRDCIPSMINSLMNLSLGSKMAGLGSIMAKLGSEVAKLGSKMA